MSATKTAEDDDEAFLNSERVVAIVNLLQKFKVKLWEMPDVGGGAPGEELQLQMRLSDESGLVEDEVAAILARLQRHSKAKLESNRRFAQDGVACFKVKVIGNESERRPVTDLV
jgi:hypothetical protein